MAFGQSRRKIQSGGGRKPKQHNAHPDRQEHILVARIEADQAKLAAIRAAKTPKTEAAKRAESRIEPDESVAKNYGDQRVVIKFFYEQMHSPPKEEWKQRYGTISRIRLLMGDSAPKPETVERTLERLVAGEEDIASAHSRCRALLAHARLDTTRIRCPALRSRVALLTTMRAPCDAQPDTTR